MSSGALPSLPSPRTSSIQGHTIMTIHNVQRPRSKKQILILRDVNPRPNLWSLYIGQWVVQYNQQQKMFPSLLNLADFVTVISGALPAPSTSSIQNHTAITFHNVSPAWDSTRLTLPIGLWSICLQRVRSKRTNMKTARFERTTHPWWLHPTG